MDVGEPNEVLALRDKVRELTESNERLLATIDDLRGKMAFSNPEPVNDTYTLDQFIVKVTTIRGRAYGWKTDYAMATANTPGSHRVSTDDIGKWQKEKRVPDWAYAQIEWLKYPTRIGRARPEWTDNDVEYLVDLCITDPHETNGKLAEKCTAHFDREITSGAIKGARFRLAQIGRLPEHRPPRR